MKIYEIYDGTRLVRMSCEFTWRVRRTLRKNPGYRLVVRREKPLRKKRTFRPHVTGPKVLAFYAALAAKKAAKAAKKEAKRVMRKEAFLIKAVEELAAAWTVREYWTAKVFGLLCRVYA